MRSEQVSWGVLGCARIAVTQVMPAIKRAAGAILVGVASRSLEKARETAARFDARPFGSYAALLEDPTIEAVYIAVPNNLHKQWTEAALNAGKHVLCEKPVAVNAAEAAHMEAVARQRDRLVLEAFMYRFAPVVRKALHIVRSGMLGELRAIYSAFNYVVGDDPNNIRLQRELGGGALLDAGCYCISIERMLAAREPVEVWAALEWSRDYGVDVAGTGMLDFGKGLRGTFYTGMDALWDSYLRVSGTEGILEAPLGFLGREPEAVLFVWHRGCMHESAHPSATPHVIDVKRMQRIVLEQANPYLLMIEDMTDAIRGRRPALYGRESLEANMRVIDACFASDKLRCPVRL